MCFILLFSQLQYEYVRNYKIKQNPCRRPLLDPFSSDENEYNVEDVQKVINNVNEFKKVANIYINKNKKSFALVQNITTVSKIRIKKPVNHYDPIKNLIADSLILDLVDNKIKELFINDK